MNHSLPPSQPDPPNPQQHNADAPVFSIAVALDDSLDLIANALDTGWLKEQLIAVVGQLRLTDVELSIVIVGDVMMATLHEEYSDIPGTTDVLTFDLRDDPFDPPSGTVSNVDGEIYVCLDEARRRAAERGHDVSRELLLYAVHGLLHLLGYDDHDPQDHARMHEKEDQLLQAIGVGRVFGRQQ